MQIGAGVSGALSWGSHKVTVQGTEGWEEVVEPMSWQGDLFSLDARGALVGKATFYDRVFVKAMANVGYHSLSLSGPDYDALPEERRTSSSLVGGAKGYLGLNLGNVFVQGGVGWSMFTHLLVAEFGDQPDPAMQSKIDSKKENQGQKTFTFEIGYSF